jgi:hypothetical protein
MRCADPWASIACAQQGQDLVVRELPVVRRIPWNEAHSVEPQQSRVSFDPEISVLGLRNVFGRAGQIPFPNSPRAV